VGTAIDVHGFCDAAYAPVRSVFENNFEQGLEVGASFAAVVDGELVIDLWAGHADAARTRTWERDTIVNVFSTTKAMAALCLNMLIDRGQVDADAPVADYWPEFAAAGKETVLVSHVMSHSSGLSGWTEAVTVDDVCDWERSTSLLAAQEPWWEPGTASGYHALTHGHLMGEIVRRVDGRTLGRFFAEEVAGPLGADFFIGLPESEEPRVAEMVPPEDLTSVSAAMAELSPDSVAIRTLTNPLLTGDVANVRKWRAAEIPAANGQGNARSVATVAGAIASGKLLSGKQIERILETRTDGTDLVIGVPIRFGLGFGLPNESFPVATGERAFFWGGWGGSTVIVDLDARAGYSYVMNKMSPDVMADPRGAALGLTMMAALIAA
jgi:CubicO group peptidase (beta-lactamase class C family)